MPVDPRSGIKPLEAALKPAGSAEHRLFSDDEHGLRGLIGNQHGRGVGPPEILSKGIFDIARSGLLETLVLRKHGAWVVGLGSPKVLHKTMLSARELLGVRRGEGKHALDAMHSPLTRGALHVDLVGI